MIEFKCPYPGCSALLKMGTQPDPNHVYGCICTRIGLVFHGDSVKPIKAGNLEVTFNKGAKETTYDKDKYVCLGEIYPKENKWATVEVVIRGHRVPDKENPRITRPPKASEPVWEVMLRLPAAFELRCVPLTRADSTKANARWFAKQLLLNPQEAMFYLGTVLLHRAPDEFKKLFDYGFLKEVESA